MEGDCVMKERRKEGDCATKEKQIVLQKRKKEIVLCKKEKKGRRLHYESALQRKLYDFTECLDLIEELYIHD